MVPKIGDLITVGRRIGLVTQLCERAPECKAQFGQRFAGHSRIEVVPFRRIKAILTDPEAIDTFLGIRLIGVPPLGHLRLRKTEPEPEPREICRSCCRPTPFRLEFEEPLETEWHQSCCARKECYQMLAKRYKDGYRKQNRKSK